MLNTIYRLVEPGRFEEINTEINTAEDCVIVKPTHISICNADQRYYQGKRPAEILKKKLPMALIHEGVGTVVADSMGQFTEGETVVMIPNTPVEEDEYVAENYLRSSKFRASGFDGFMQDNVAMSRNRIIRLPETIDKEVAAFTEIISVSYGAISRFMEFSHKRRDTIAVWGDGNLAFATALLVRYRLPESKLIIFGLDREKLKMFTFADETHHIDEIPEDIYFNHAFECVGGNGSPVAINQIIDYIQPEGTISILGVTEELAPLNTRMVLEKGLKIFGSSRSGRSDFEGTVALYAKYPEIVEQLKHIVGNVVEVNTVEDMNNAFDVDFRKTGGKTIMIWKR